MHRNTPSLFEVADHREGSFSPLRPPEDTSLARLHFPALASSPNVRSPKYELSMLAREQGAGLRL